MKLKFILSLFFFVLKLSTITAQNKTAEAPLKPDYKHSIGFQLNPFIDEFFWHNISTIELSDFLWVSSLRYLYAMESVQRLRLGGETYLHLRISDITHYSFLSIGPLLKYDVFKINRLAFGAEFSPYMIYEKLKFRNLNEQQTPIYKDVSDFRFAYYIAPVISLKSKNSRWTYDFSWKFSGKEIIDRKKQVPSFKISYLF